jgi:hypothetical protein
MEDSMTTVRALIAGLLVFVTALSSTALAAQSSTRHVLDRPALASAVAERVAAGDAQRAAVQEALARPEVRSVAAKAGVNVDRLAAQVATLDDTDLAQVADAAQQVNQSSQPLVGGASTVVISTTTIIIVLLLIILIVVAVD